MNYHVINQYLAPYVKKGEEKTFAGHVDYFKQNNQLSMTTVVDQWSKLNNENKIKVGMKTAILCPHLNSIKNGHIINQFGTMVVNADNTINMAALKDLLKTCFKKHTYTINIIINISQITNFILFGQSGLHWSRCSLAHSFIHLFIHWFR